jgi:hypothetical protein
MSFKSPVQIIDEVEEMDKLFIPFRESILSQIAEFQNTHNCKILDLGDFNFVCHMKFKNNHHTTQSKFN